MVSYTHSLPYFIRRASCALVALCQQQQYARRGRASQHGLGLLGCMVWSQLTYIHTYMFSTFSMNHTARYDIILSLHKEHSNIWSINPHTYTHTHTHTRTYTHTHTHTYTCMHTHTHIHTHTYTHIHTGTYTYIQYVGIAENSPWMNYGAALSSVIESVCVTFQSTPSKGLHTSAALAFVNIKTSILSTELTMAPTCNHSKWLPHQ